jgi:HK97 family phage portal protein
MNLVSSIGQWLTVFNQYFGGRVVAPEYRQLFGGEAETYAAYFYCVSKIAGDLYRIPLELHKKRGDDDRPRRLPAKDHIAHHLVCKRPNQYQRPGAFRETLTAHALSWGNGRAAIVRDEFGRPVELLPLLPDRTVTGMVKGEKWHACKPNRDERVDSLLDDMRTSPGDVVLLPDRDVIHLMGRSPDGVVGLGVLETAARTIQTALNAEKQVQSLAERGFVGQVMLEVPPGVLPEEEDAREFLEQFRKAHSGPDGQHIGMLREGIKATMTPLNAREAQWLEQRKFSRQDIALFFGLEHIPGDGEKVSYNTLEQRNLNYLQSALGLWIERWEQELDAKLLTDMEQDHFFFAYDTKVLLRMDTEAKARVTTQLVRSEIINPNEARVEFDYPPYAAGEDFRNPAIVSTPPGEVPAGERGAATNQLQRVIERRLVSLLDTEAKRIETNLFKAADQHAWIDQFYGKWQAQIEATAEELELDSVDLLEQCRQRQAQIAAAIAANPSAPTQKKSCTEILQSWRERQTANAQELQHVQTA